MQAANTEIYFIIVIGAVLALMLVGFIVSILFLYQRRQHRQEQELVRIKEEYERETLRSQLEIQEATFKTLRQELHDNIGQVLSVVNFRWPYCPWKEYSYAGVWGEMLYLSPFIQYWYLISFFARN